MVLMAISGCIIALVETVFSRALKTSIVDVPLEDRQSAKTDLEELHSRWSLRLLDWSTGAVA